MVFLGITFEQPCFELNTKYSWGCWECHYFCVGQTVKLKFHLMKSQRITKATTIHPERNMNVCTIFHGNPSHSWTEVDTSLKTTKVQLKLKLHFLAATATYQLCTPPVLCSPLRQNNQKPKGRNFYCIFLGFKMPPPSFALIWRNIIDVDGDLIDEKSDILDT